VASECIDWTGAVTSAGYAAVYERGSGYGRADGKVVLAHRAAYEREVGPIPPGQTVHHTCGNRVCVNVAHMELLLRDEHAGGRGHGRLTRDEAERVRALLADGWRGVDVAAHFGISKQQVSNIRAGRCWA
jgi:hypothetical protein